MVLLAMPVIQDVERIEHPSTKAETTRARSAVLSLFILVIMLERSSIAKSFSIFFFGKADLLS
jgi:hypothetical protein